MTTDKLISDITLQFLMNKDQYARYVNSDFKQSVKKNKKSKDKKFYKKRIIELTRNMINNEPLVMKNSNLESAFEDYISCCIDYFKLLDKTDIIQEEYVVPQILDNNNDNDNDVENMDMDNESDYLDTNDEQQSQININYMMNRKEKTKTLDDFVKKISNIEPMILPRKKKYNLKDPKLKMKGIRQKENITTIYEEVFKKENGEQPQEQDNKED
jgi:mRNA-degrading endonuclease YafQ of YafQ-DinJ toxin-antitoxin module